MRYAMQVFACALVAVMLGLLGGALLYVDGGEMTCAASISVIALVLFMIWAGVFLTGNGEGTGQG